MKKSKHSYKQGGEHKVDGRVCVECKTTTTPQWRYGVNGPLCNACGTRQKRSAKQWHRNSNSKCPSTTRLKVASSADLAALAAQQERSLNPAYMKGYMTKVIGVAGAGQELEYRTGSRSRRTAKPSNGDARSNLKRKQQDFYPQPTSSLSAEGGFDSDTATVSANSDTRSSKLRRSVIPGPLNQLSSHPPFTCIPHDTPDLLEDAAHIAPALLMLAQAANAQDEVPGSRDSLLDPKSLCTNDTIPDVSNKKLARASRKRSTDSLPEAKVTGIDEAAADMNADEPGRRLQRRSSTRMNRQAGSLPFMTDDYLVSKSTARILSRLHGSSRRHRSPPHHIPETSSNPTIHPSAPYPDKTELHHAAPCTKQAVFDIEKMSDALLGPSKARQAGMTPSAPKLDSRSSSVINPAAEAQMKEKQKYNRDEQENVQLSSSTLVAKLTAFRSNFMLDTCITSSPRSCSTVAAVDPAADTEVASPHTQAVTRQMGISFKRTGLSKSSIDTCNTINPINNTNNNTAEMNGNTADRNGNTAGPGQCVDGAEPSDMLPLQSNAGGNAVGRTSAQLEASQEPGPSTHCTALKVKSSSDLRENGENHNRGGDGKNRNAAAGQLPNRSGSEAGQTLGQTQSTAVQMEVDGDAAGATAPLSSALHEIRRLLSVEQCRTSHLEASLQKAFTDTADVHSRLLVAKYEKEQLTVLARHWRDSFEELQGKYQQVLAENSQLRGQLAVTKVPSWSGDTPAAW